MINRQLSDLWKMINRDKNANEMEGAADTLDVSLVLVTIIQCSVTPFIGTETVRQIEGGTWETIKKPIVGGNTFRMIHGAYNACTFLHLFTYGFCNGSEHFDFPIFTLVLTFLGWI